MRERGDNLGPFRPTYRQANTQTHTHTYSLHTHAQRATKQRDEEESPSPASRETNEQTSGRAALFFLFSPPPFSKTLSLLHTHARTYIRMQLSETRSRALL